jgi:hypothetical protein
MSFQCTQILPDYLSKKLDWFPVFPPPPVQVKCFARVWGIEVGIMTEHISSDQNFRGSDLHRILMALALNSGQGCQSPVALGSFLTLKLWLLELVIVT